MAIKDHLTETDFDSPETSPIIQKTLYRSVIIRRMIIAYLKNLITKSGEGISAKTLMSSLPPLLRNESCFSDFLDNFAEEAGICRNEFGYFESHLANACRDPEEIPEEVKKAFPADYYALYDMKSAFQNLFPDSKISFDENLINKLGFKRINGAIIRNGKKVPQEAFRQIIYSANRISKYTIPEEIWNDKAFKKVLNKAEESGRIVRIDKDVFAKFQDFADIVHLSPAVIRKWIKDSITNIPESECFTVKYYIHNQKGNIFNEDENLNGYKYELLSLLISTNELKHSVYNGTWLFCKHHIPRLVDIIRSVIWEDKDLQLYIFTISEKLEAEYGIEASEGAIKSSIAKSELYYDEITERVYAEKSVYTDEYNEIVKEEQERCI